MISLRHRHPTQYRRRAVAASILCWALSAPSFAQNEVVIYRCTDAAGNVTLQNDKPCAKGQKQEIRMIGTLPSSPVAAPAPIARPAPAPTPAPTIQPAPPPQPAAFVRQPPPAIFQCRTWDDRDYYGDTGEPPATCAPLQTVGIDGSPQRGNVSACEMRRDTCTAIEPEQLCRAWKRRIDEAEFRWRFAGSQNDERKAEFDRFAKTYNESTCVR